MVLTGGASLVVRAQAVYTAADLEEGAANFMNSCAVCHGPDGDFIPGAALNRPPLRRAATRADLERIILSGIPNTPMPPANLNTRQLDTIVAYLQSLGAGRPGTGDAAKGRAIFEGAAGCMNCHRVNGRGGWMGPDLSDIGMLRRASNLERSLVDPGAEIRSENRILTAVTKEGKTVRGRILNHNTQSVQLAGPDGRPVSFERSGLRSLTQEAGSPMPSFRSRLTASELSDLITYLISLRGVK
jgi:putative heme-binding domain-containing protein